MTSTPQARTGWRLPLMCLAVAVATGAGAVAMGAAPVTVRSCTGLPEFIAVIAGFNDTLAIGSAVRIAEIVLVSTLCGLLTWAGFAATGSLASAGAAAAAAGVLLVQPGVPALAIAGPLTVFAAAWSLVSPGSRPLARLALLATVAAVTPPLGLLAAVLAVLDSRTTSGWSGASALVVRPLVVMTAALAGALIVPALPGHEAPLGLCLLPATSTDALAALPGAVASPLSAAGPFAGALAVLGLLSLARGPHPAGWLPAALLISGSCLSDLQSGLVPPPTLVVVTLLVTAAGLAELGRAVRHSRLVAPAIVAFGLILPLSVFVRVTAQPRAAAVADTAVERLSLAGLSRLIDHVPPHGLLVRESAGVDLLMRTAAMRGSPLPHVIDAIPAAVRAATQAAPVVAMPGAQRWLQLRGFSLVDLDAAPGLARVEARGACRALQSAWRRIADLETADTLAIVGETPSDTGPVLIYALFDARPELFSLDWPAESIPGFAWQRYAPGDTSLRSDLARDGLTLDDLDASSLHALRLTQSRSVTAPLALASTFHLRPHAVFARLSDDAAGQRLSVCPAYPHDVLPLAQSSGTDD